MCAVLMQDSLHRAKNPQQGWDTPHGTASADTLLMGAVSDEEEVPGANMPQEPVQADSGVSPYELQLVAFEGEGEGEGVRPYELQLVPFEDEGGEKAEKEATKSENEHVRDGEDKSENERGEDDGAKSDNESVHDGEDKSENERGEDDGAKSDNESVHDREDKSENESDADGSAKSENESIHDGEDASEKPGAKAKAKASRVEAKATARVKAKAKAKAKAKVKAKGKPKPLLTDTVSKKMHSVTCINMLELSLALRCTPKRTTRLRRMGCHHDRQRQQLMKLERSAWAKHMGLGTWTSKVG